MMSLEMRISYPNQIICKYYLVIFLIDGGPAAFRFRRIFPGFRALLEVADSPRRPDPNPLSSSGAVAPEMEACYPGRECNRGDSFDDDKRSSMAEVLKRAMWSYEIVTPIVP
jgi:hypothetical protein